jgi:protein tyrosine phosphatase (PTP) superfamily phosphohydrolase (DUF442 family)
MGNARKVSDELSVAGQVTSEQLQQAAQDGFKIEVMLKKLRGGFLLA